MSHLPCNYIKQEGNKHHYMKQEYLYLMKQEYLSPIFKEKLQ